MHQPGPSLLDLPELSGNLANSIRIPPELDVPVTSRVMALVETPQMQRLKRITQLGLVGHVYPGATHTRFEHSLGVYRLACEVLRHLLGVDSHFASRVTDHELKIFLVAALMHDVGHWPYCHPLEDLGLPWIPKHESLALAHLSAPEVHSILQSQWGLAPHEVSDFLSEQPTSGVSPVLYNVLNGPVDIDKMDYLQRDSLHAGVPYGRNFDSGRLIKSLCINHDEQSLAITPKGKTATELLVFARYVMFSEVYWHHTVRSATAMLQRLVYSIAQATNAAELGAEALANNWRELWLQQTDSEFAEQMLECSRRIPDLASLACGLFGVDRRLYKRVAQYSHAENPQIHAALAQRPYPHLVQCAAKLAKQLSRGLARPLLATDVLLDAPPVKLEVQFRMGIRLASGTTTDAVFAPLTQQSPVVRALATDQFDSFVKQVRVFIAPDRVQEISFTEESLADSLIAAASSCSTSPH
ncbi:HD domain-containing protein [Aureliella helgolandensis]|uniref:HD/PDEase domain-containing protein n=1 Tax=Aureliella helgolandensis TaxID=2527968 RepID=A0A518G6A1_9BACT|nr:HD domain-containing protein [Aureliella helgolandensis]QDV24117.1 hypothetical protein Q31a_24300 [Aureliella helgolandensis]